MVQSARPLTTLPSSLTSRGLSGARRTTMVSGERKKYVLQSGRGHGGLRAQLRERANDLRDGAVRPAVGGHEELDYPGNILIVPGPQSVRQIEQELATMRQADRLIAPENATGISGDDAGDRLHQRGLAGAVGPD